LYCYSTVLANPTLCYVSGAQDPQVCALREALDAQAGIPGLETDIIDPAEAGFAEKAAEVFLRDGFCL
jgi:hypothetical protein